jgi:hypothetical protein
MKTDTQTDKLKQGTPVMCNGYKGAIIRHYDGDMYEIRLERGSVCTDQFEVIQDNELRTGSEAIIALDPTKPWSFKTPTDNERIALEIIHRTGAQAGDMSMLCIIIAQVRAEAKAQADKLAEELRKLFEIVPYSGTISAREALEAYEKEMQS